MQFKDKKNKEKKRREFVNFGIKEENRLKKITSLS